MLVPNTILQNRYRVIRELGHGGMGTVYEALDQRVNCLVALKETMAGTNDEARRAFEREASLLGNLRQPALPKVMDYFSEDSGDFLVMEFIPGFDLAELLESRGSPFPQSQVLGWADELLKLLAYLHARQPPILHRDIKPANLKLTDQGEIFLLDFGLAKGSTGQMPTLGESRSVFGYTPSYASLEQILGQGTDPRSDLYSLAATLYHLLAGVPATDAATRFNAIEDDKPDPLRAIVKLNPKVSASVAATIHQAMAINRKNRPASAAEMCNALRNAVEEVGKKEQEEADRTLRSNHADRAASTVTVSAAPKNHATPAMKTMPSPQADRASLDQFSGRPNEVVASALTVRSTSKRNAIIGAVVLIVLVGIAILIWSLSGPPTIQDANKLLPTAMPVMKPGTVMKSQMGLELVYVPPGSFMMGSDNGKASEKPVHEVTIKEGFYMGRYEVTQGQWQSVMGNNPSNFKNCDNCPIERVSWDDAQQFLAKLNERNDGFHYRLPSEAEWEYACRAATTGDYAGDLDSMAWYGNNSGNSRLDADAIFRDDQSNYFKRLNDNGNKKHPVGSKQPNAFGLYDMHGNIQEWCQDWGHDNYNGAPTDGSAWLSGREQKSRVLRGGSWYINAPVLRSASRNWITPLFRDIDIRDTRDIDIGFRVVGVARTQ